MSPTLLLGGLWKMLPPACLEPVTLYPRVATGGYTGGVNIAQARRHPLTNTATGARAAITEETGAWSLWTDTFASAAVPKPGDRISDQNGVNYVILPEVKRNLLGREYFCRVRREL